MTSSLYTNISERINYFDQLEEIMAESDCKIIVEYDSVKAESYIAAKYFLFKRFGNPLKNEPVTYCNLFIGHDGEADKYFPATYTVEHSKKYVSEQRMLNCRIYHV